MTMVNNTPRQPDVSRFANGLNNAVRDNPIAAALIGIGAVWMFVGGAKLAAAGGAVAGATKDAGGAVGAGIASVSRAVGGQIASTASAAGGAALGIKDEMIEGVQRSGAMVRDAASAGLQSLTPAADAAAGIASHAAATAEATAGRGTELFGAWQRKLTGTLERQPLVLGGIGLAIGAGIASAFALTLAESRLIGDSAAKLRGSVESLASEAAQSAREVASEAIDAMKDEAARQGLTPPDMKSGLQDVGEKLKTVAGAVQDSVKRRL